jgi:acetylornithine deacetylase
MASDARRAVRSVPGVRSVSVLLEDHYTGEEINGALARGDGFASAFPGETAGDVEAEVAGLIDGRRDATARTLLVREPFEIAPEEPVVTAVRDSATRVLGAPPAIGGASFWADSAFIAAAGIPTVLFGPGGAGAHAVEEWVSIPDTVACVAILTDVAAALAG